MKTFTRLALSLMHDLLFIGKTVFMSVAWFGELLELLWCFALQPHATQIMRTFSMAMAMLVLAGMSGDAVLNDTQSYDTVPSTKFRVELDLINISGEIYPQPQQACGPNCLRELRDSRSTRTALEAEQVEYVRKAYNELIFWQAWRINAKRCVDRLPAYERAEVFTHFPAELMAGKSLIESSGCRYITARNGDGGVGPMQITHPSPKVFRQVALMTGMTESEVMEANCFHVEGEARAVCARSASERDFFVNVLTGTVMYDSFEARMESRGAGFVAYNHGPGNTRRAIRTVGGSLKGRTISEFREAIPCYGNGRGCPQTYADRILAGAVMVDRVKRGLPLSPLAEGELQLMDIPGWNPEFDITIP